MQKFDIIKDSIRLKMVTKTLLLLALVLAVEARAKHHQEEKYRIEHHGNLRLVDNGYEGLIISINEQVPEEYCNQVVAGIKVGVVLR